MVADKQILEKWYRYAAGADGFIGGALRRHRALAFFTQEQQRAHLGIRDKTYDRLWLRLQSMPLPRQERWIDDLKRIVEYVLSHEGVVCAVNTEALGELISSGLPGTQISSLACPGSDHLDEKAAAYLCDSIRRSGGPSC